MPQRDPETGQFLSGGSAGDFGDYDRIDQIHNETDLTVPAADLEGGTAEGYGEGMLFEGVELYDAETVLDRHEVGVVLWAAHRLAIVTPSTQTADGTARVASEWSFSPSVSSGTGAVEASTPIEDTMVQTGNGFTINRDSSVDDTADVLGPSLAAFTYSPFSDGVNGLGGAGGIESDSWEGSPVVDPVVDDRDSIFLNGAIEASNIADGSISVDVRTWHVIGVLED